MIYDTFSFFNELDILEIRLNILSPLVDKFVLCESPETFSGHKKPLYYEENKKKFKKWNQKIIHLVIDDYPNDQKIVDLMDNSSYVPKELPHYRRAFYQKESIKRALIKLNNNDTVYYGDVDEIWKPKEIDEKSYKLWQICYSYFLNNRSSERWAGNIVTKYKNIKDGCLNDLRAKPEYFLDDGGWHFTNMGGADAIKSKIEAYDHQEFNKPDIKSQIEKRMKNNEDYLGRRKDYSGKKFQFWSDDKNLPSFLKKNKKRYSHLFR